ncbi:MAG: DUF4105 domain-containing protein [Bacteroidales bacterium]
MKMLKYFFVLLLSLFGASYLSAQNLTRNAEISLITCSPGTQELYAYFGHSAFRVKDTSTNTDIIFNYGVFDFDTPNFYWKFIQGKLKYELAIQPTYHFFQMYANEGREVKEEKLLLTAEEKKDVLNYLEWNYKPENRYYTYDFFYDNCSSKIWDVVKSQLHTDYECNIDNYEEKTFRQMLHEYLENATWIYFGIDIALGLPADKTADFEEQMFLPDYLSQNMSLVSREDTISGKRGILDKENIVIRKQEKEQNEVMLGNIMNPVLIAWMLFIGVVLLTFFGKYNFKRWFDVIFFSLSGLLGVFFLFLWVGTDHTAMNANMDMLWANPFSILFVITFIRQRTRLIQVFTFLLLISVLVLLVGWFFLPQQFHPAIFPLALLILLRMLNSLFTYFFNYGQRSFALKYVRK